MPPFFHLCHKFKNFQMNRWVDEQGQIQISKIERKNKTTELWVDLQESEKLPASKLFTTKKWSTKNLYDNINQIREMTHIYKSIEGLTYWWAESNTLTLTPGYWKYSKILRITAYLYTLMFFPYIIHLHNEIQVIYHLCHSCRTNRVCSWIQGFQFHSNSKLVGF